MGRVGLPLNVVAASERRARDGRWTTPGEIPIVFHHADPPAGTHTTDRDALWLHLEHARLSLLRGFDELLCLEGLHGVEQLPHQIETVRRVLRHFHGRVLLADEVGLGKTIEACLLLREYLLRGLVRRVLILVPTALVSQWHEELWAKFGLSFAIPPRTGAADREQYWHETDRVLVSHSYAKAKKRAHLVAAAPWDLVIVDEAHHCKNRATLNWQLVNSLQRRHMFLLTATPVQNDLVELYNLLTLLQPGHLRTEADFKRQFVRRGSPRDPRNRERLRGLLGEVMIRNTRSLVHVDLPPRYAQTVQAHPTGAEAELYALLEAHLRQRGPQPTEERVDTATEDANREAAAAAAVETAPADKNGASAEPTLKLSRMQLAALLAAQGSHPAALCHALERSAADPAVRQLLGLAQSIDRSAKDEKLLDLVRQSHDHKLLVFVNFRRTLHRLADLLTAAGVAFSVFSGDQNSAEKDAAVEEFRQSKQVMLCTESGGEGRNLQFADTLINYDLPWNPMQIEQRIGRLHRIGQTRDVFVFNLCTAGSLEARILHLLSDKIRMFELVVGEVGSILGNLDEGEEFETLVLNMWIRARDSQDLEQSFESLGATLLDAQEKYLQTKELDEALFGEDYQ